MCVLAFICCMPMDSSSKSQISNCGGRKKKRKKIEREGENKQTERERSLAEADDNGYHREDERVLEF